MKSLKTFKGTKGQWDVLSNPNDEFSELIVGTGVQNVCDIRIIDKHNKDIEAFANAKLIASAPELLEALQEVWKLIENGDLVRDISKDGDMSYFLKQGLRITSKLGKVEKAINKAL